MAATTRPFTERTAGDVMSRDVLTLRGDMPLREAACLLLSHQISGAPVVQPGGTCVGVLSTTDILRWAHAPAPAAGERAVSCVFQLHGRSVDGEARTLCALPSGVCPLQRTEPAPGGGRQLTCVEPDTIVTDWQCVQVEHLPTESVEQFMTADPVLVTAETPVWEVARRMIDAHIHRVIVVDRRQVPIGIVSSTDLLAGLARAGSEEPVGYEVLA